VIPLVAAVCFLITLPTFFEYKTVPCNITDKASPNSTQPFLRNEYTQLALDPLYSAVYNWVTALSFMFVPLSILTVFNLFLIRSVRKSSQKRKQWIADQQPTQQQQLLSPFQWKPIPTTGSCKVRSMQHARSFKKKLLKLPQSKSLRITSLSTKLKSTTSSLIRRPEKNNNGYQHHPKTLKPGAPSEKILQTPTYRLILRQDAHITRLLIAVVLFFLICQLPAALVMIYKACRSRTSPNEAVVLEAIGNVFNMLVAINSAGNFALYCLLSRKYRRTLMDLIAKLKQHS